MARPFKVLISEQKEQFGVVARSLRVLRDSIQRRYGLQSGFKIFLTDGTTVDNEEYFAFLEPQTLLIVKHAIPSGDTKTSVVDLTSKLASKEVEALVCTEKHSEENYQQQKNVSDKRSVENNGVGTQTSAVLSIKIAKVQEDVEWENGGTSQPNASSTSMCYQQQQHQVQPPIQTDPVTNSTITLHHPNHMPYPTRMAQTPTTPATSRASTVVHHHQPQPHHQQLQSMDVAMLQELYQQGQFQKRYYHQQQQMMSQTQACNAPLRPSQRYYLQQVQQQQQQQASRNRNLQIVRQLSSCGYNGTDAVQQKHQQLMYIPPQ